MGLIADRAALGREWLLHGHLTDRATMPLYLAVSSREEMLQLAIDEWMAASPVYTRRAQSALRFEGDDVVTIFKGLQLDVGAPHQFMDFRYLVHDARNGEFWLAHCGALMDVEPMGEEMVYGMCHTIEDPTFDATAVATNRRARVRPLHRPPRTPADRHPHCHWTVTIDPDGEEIADHPNLASVEQMPAARVPVRQPRSAAAGAGGLADRSGGFDPDFVLEDLSDAALEVALEEVALQGHILAGSCLLALTQRLGYEEAIKLGHRALVGIAGVTAERLMGLAGPEGQRESPAEALASLLRAHPVLNPAPYVDIRVQAADDAKVRLSLLPCPATEEDDRYSWLACIDALGPAPLEAIARAVDPRFRCEVVEPEAGERRAWMLHAGPATEPSREPTEMALVKLSTGAAFQFQPPR